MASIKYEVSGLTCNGCVKRVKAVLSEHAEKVEFTLIPLHVSVNIAARHITSKDFTSFYKVKYNLILITLALN